MQRLEVSGVVRPIYGSLGVKGLKNEGGHQHWSSSETPFVRIISEWIPVELQEFPGWRTRSRTTL